MPTPEGLNTTPLHGQFVEPDETGTPLQGTLTFTPSPSPVLFPDQNVIVAGTETADLDENGEFNIELVSTDVSNNGNPPTWVYTVVEKIIGQRQRTYFIALPYTNGEVVELSDIEPAPSAPSYIPVTGPVGAPGLVTSVNGYSLANIVLDAEDVGAVDAATVNQPNGVVGIGADGRVGIGITGPWAKFMVQSDQDEILAAFVQSNPLNTAPGFLVQGATPNWGAFGSSVAGDAANRINFSAGGKLSWGSGAAATDVDLARSGVGELQVTGQMLSSEAAPTADAHLTRKDYVDLLDAQNVKLEGGQTIPGLKTFTGGAVFTTVAPQFTGATFGTTALRSNASGETTDRFQMKASGEMAWGDGTNTRNTLLARIADGELQVTSQVSVTGAAPTADDHLTRKDYVDDLVAAREGVVTLETSQVITGFKTWEMPLSSSGALQTRALNDTQSRFYLRADGRMAWGPGNEVQDTFLYRESAKVLALDDTAIRGYRASASSVSYITKIPSDTQNRFQLLVDGTLAWGTGSAAQDITMFRDDANSVKINGQLKTAGYLTAQAGVGVTGGVTLSGNLTFGADVNLYRSAANILKTDDALEVAGTLKVGGKTVPALGNWVVPTASGWYVTPNNSTYQSLRVRSDGFRAYLDGAASTKTAYSSGSQNAFTLPAGYAPLVNHYYSLPRATSGSPPTLGIVVQTDGTVVIYTSSSVTLSDTWDFSAISWPLD